MNVSSMLKSLRKVVVKRSPDILIGLGLVGMGGSIVCAVRNTPAATRAIQREEDRKEDSLTCVEKVRATYKLYLPAGMLFATSTFCILAGHSINTKRNVALLTAYTASEVALQRARAAAMEHLGPKKQVMAREDEGKVAISGAKYNEDTVIETRFGDTLCFDAWSGRYYRSDSESIRQAVNRVNHQLNVECSISLNDLYYELGLPNVYTGDLLGWNIEDGLLDIRYSSHLAENNDPCLVMMFDKHPQPNFV